MGRHARRVMDTAERNYKHWDRVMHKWHARWLHTRKRVADFERRLHAARKAAKHAKAKHAHARKMTKAARHHLKRAQNHHAKAVAAHKRAQAATRKAHAHMKRAHAARRH